MPQKRRRRQAPKPATRPTTPTAEATQGTVATRTTIQESYSGPLPKASELEAYNRIDPTFANRIFTMAEGFAEHVQQLEREAMREERVAQRWGRGIAATVVAAVLGTCIWALYLDKEEFAVTLGSWTIVALAAVFVAGKLPAWMKNKDE